MPFISHSSPVLDPDKRTTLTLSITEGDKYLLKGYALRQGVSVSQLLHDWLIEHIVSSDKEAGTNE